MKQRGCPKKFTPKQILAERKRIILLMREGATIMQIAEVLGLKSRQAVYARHGGGMRGEAMRGGKL